MRHQMDIRFAPTEGALLRILGLIEPRGFKVERVTMQPDTDAESRLNLGLVPLDEGRSFSGLQRQVAKLLDVHDVQLADAKSAELG